MARGSLIPGTKGDRVALDFKGMRDLMRSPAIQSELEGRMSRVQAALPGSDLRVSAGKVRARAVVARGSDFDEENTCELSKALDLAGGQRRIREKTSKPRARSN